jgi:hypothetical protein
VLSRLITLLPERVRLGARYILRLLLSIRTQLSLVGPLLFSLYLGHQPHLGGPPVGIGHIRPRNRRITLLFGQIGSISLPPPSVEQHVRALCWTPVERLFTRVLDGHPRTHLKVVRDKDLYPAGRIVIQLAAWPVVADRELADGLGWDAETFRSCGVC